LVRGLGVLVGDDATDSLVSEEKGFLKERSMASLIAVSCAVSQSTMNRAIMEVMKSA
jgi:hypothetical protein